MKIKFNGLLLSISLIFILLLSLGLVSASDNSNDLIDINYVDDAISEDECMDVDLCSVSEGDLDDGLDDSQSTPKSYSSPSTKEIIGANGGNDFNSIQSLIDQSEENGTVTIGGVYYGDSKIIIDKPLKMIGNDSGATLDGQFLTSILEVNSANVLISNIRFINSYDMALSIGGKNVTIENCSFENSINGELGSALSCYGDNVKILNSRFLNNIANKSSCHHTDGPTIYLIANNAVIDGCTFINNTGYNYETASSGGAIWLKGTNCSVLNSVFVNNSATSKFAWTLHSEEQTFLADGHGGAIFWVGNNAKIDNCSFINCISHSDGGALYFKAANGCSISNSNFTQNYAVGDAGAIYLGQNVFNFEISNSQFRDNVALGLQGIISSFNAYGGAIFASEFVENMTVSNSSFLNNYGNGTIYYKGSNLQVSNSILNRSNPIIKNSTLEKFLGVIKDSTKEECNKEITDFALYQKSGSFFEAVIFNDGSINNNNWGDNFNNSDEFIQMKLIKSNDEYISPNFWINLKLVNGSEGTAIRNKSAIEYENMTTTAVDTSVDGRAGKYFSIRLKDENGVALANKHIQIGFNGQVYDRTTDKNGQAKLQINLKAAGTYTFAVCFLGDDEFNGSFVVAKIVVNKQKPVISISNYNYKATAKSKKISISLKSASKKALKNKTVKLVLNGKTYTAKTNSKGVATINVSLSKKGTYSFTVKYAGDNTYAAVSKNAKLVIS